MYRPGNAQASYTPGKSKMLGTDPPSGPEIDRPIKASIDYLRYLEGCISDLKIANNALSTPLVQPQAPPLRVENVAMDDDEDEDEEDQDQGQCEQEDAPMEDAPTGTGTTTATRHQHQTNLKSVPVYTSPQSLADSPALSDPQPRRPSSYASSVSTLPSPAFGPQTNGTYFRPHSHHSSSTSPTIMPSKEQDEEATATLLMLNKDRRHSKEKSKRGLSVSDLLTH